MAKGSAEEHLHAVVSAAFQTCAETAEASLTARTEESTQQHSQTSAIQCEEEERSEAGSPQDAVESAQLQAGLSALARRLNVPLHEVTWMIALGAGLGAAAGLAQ
jgi:hypothetical protein